VKGRQKKLKEDETKTDKRNEGRNKFL
jgi:hypothetical protein